MGKSRQSRHRSIPTEIRVQLGEQPQPSDQANPQPERKPQDQGGKQIPPVPPEPKEPSPPAPRTPWWRHLI